jgi:hypothetical protein
VPRSQGRLHHRPWGSGQHSLAVAGAKSIPTRLSCGFRCRWREARPGSSFSRRVAPRQWR